MARESKQKRDEKRFGKSERLADVAFSGQWKMPKWCDSTPKNSEFAKSLGPLRQEILEVLSEATVISADNVCEFLYANNPQEYWEYKNDFPNCAPPFSRFFLEFARPSRILSGSTVKSAASLPERWGWLFKVETRAEIEARLSSSAERNSTRDYLASQLAALHPLIDEAAIMRAKSSPDPDSAFQRLGARERTFVALGAQYVAIERGMDIRGLLSEEIEWGATAMLLVAAEGNIASPAFTNLLITKSGIIHENPIFSTLGGTLMAGSDSENVSDGWGSMFFPALLALSFMNCKNVTTNAVGPDPKLNRERRKAGLKPFLRYHTINIEPMKRVLKTEGNIETEGLKKALHICRGHFATYSEDKPLFGHFSGTVWKPAHVRGSAKQGVVVSDYNVQAPGPNV